MNTVVLQEASEVISRARDLIKTVQNNPAKLDEGGEQADTKQLEAAINALHTAEKAIGDYDKQFNQPGTPSKNAE